ncbi:ABC transporter substrate-binding protein [Pseudochelatococcus contaminans]|uniref:Putative ABC transport system substrate-binding protein n=1 Tax=Pseudochelatococcus contaminans TaxID=1538103 RepID=A0A7W5Z5W7_9HYPH|nr:putative ABC transport system substrate-binding protein [Pseudochelatococcus contaminans]
MLKTSLGATAALLLGICAPVGAVMAQTPVVAVTSIVDHPALNAVYEGAREALERAGFKDGEQIRIVFENAQGQPATAVQIARKFVGEKPDVIIAISTPSAQAAAAATRTIPVVFSAVTDPVGAQLVASIDNPGGNVTGVSDRAPVDDQVALIRELTPDVKTIGVLFNPGEPNSVSSVRELKEAAAKVGLSVVDAPATKTAEVQGAARSLVGKADAAFVPTDNTIVSALEAAAGALTAAKIPLYAADTDSVPRGALAAVGFNYRQVGEQTGDLAVRVLKGEKPAELPVRFAEGSDLHLNKGVAEKIGLTLPEAALSRAVKVVD